MNGTGAATERQYQRFTRLNRILHIFMVLSFLSLAVTGLTLKFSYTPFAAIVSHILGGFESAGYFHRYAALIMIAVFLTHIVDVLRMKRREHLSYMKLIFGPGSLMFNGNDLRDLIASVKWFVGRGPRPAYGRWTYWEKFDYFAVFWGMFAIGGTGLMLWFPTLFTLVLPGWMLNVATIIHSDEALLAVGFIFTVHFFNTHLRPDKFPMDIVVFTGRMSVEELRHDKSAEYDALVRSGTLEQYLVEPYQPIVIKAIRFFAWAALALGVSIIVWIVYAMLLS